MPKCVVLIQVRVYAEAPLVGTASRDGAEPEPFVGWLGFLSLLSRAIARASSS